MPSYSGTIGPMNGYQTLDSSINDSVTFTPTSSVYTVEYPAGTIAINGASTAQTLALTAGGQFRVFVKSGSVAYAVTDTADETRLTSAQAAAVAQGAVGGMRNNTAVSVGDSVTQQSTLTSTNQGTNTRSAVRHCNRLLGSPFRILYENGFSGKTTAEVASNWDTIISPYNPATVFWETGINNFSASQSAVTAFAEIKAVWSRCVSEGRRLVYYMTGLTFGSQFGRERAKYLAMCRQFAREYASFEFIDCTTGGLDFNQTPANLGDGVNLTNYAPDAVHPSARYAIVSGQNLALHFQRRGYPDVPIFSPFVNNGASGGDDLSNIFVNGLVGASASSWATGVTPASTRTATPTVVAMGTTGMQANLPGRLYNVVWAPGTGPADSDKMTVGQVLDVASGLNTTYGGKQFVFRCYLKASSTGGAIHQVAALALLYSWDYGTIYFNMYENECFDTTAGTPLITHGMNATAYEGIFETLPVTVPAGVTQGHFLFYAEIKAATGATVTVQMGCAEMREVFTL